MIYIKRVANADVTRQIDLAKDSARIFFGFDESIHGLQYDLIFHEKYTDQAYGGKIAKKGHSVTIPGEFFSYIKVNHKIDDIIVFESTYDPKRFLFHVFVPGEPHYNEYEALLETYGKYNGRIQKHTHLLWDEAQTIPDDGWVHTINNWIKKIEALEGKEDRITESVARELHSEWKELLAQNMMNLVRKDSRVVCPFTGVEGDYAKLPMLFIASHIKRFADSSLREKYDINNGLLLTANADALFDKYMITVSEDKKLIFSKYIDEDLKRVLNLVEIIKPEFLTDERMEYMKEHRRIFWEKEQSRQESAGTSCSTNTSIETANGNSITHNPVGYSLPEDNNPYAFAAEAEATYCTTTKSEIGLKYLFSKNIKRIIIGCYKNAEHMRWIAKNRKYNVRIGKRVGSLSDTAEDIPSAQLLILYFSKNFTKRQFYTIAESQGQKMDVDHLKSLGYPTNRSAGEYFVFDLEYEHEPIDVDIEKIIENTEKNNPGYKKGMPIVIEINNF